MKKKTLAGIAVVIVAVVLLAVFHSKNTKVVTDPNHLKIGVIDVLSGDHAALGIDFKNGLDMAHDEFLAGHASSTIELIYKDDAYDAKKGTDAFHDLINKDHVDALIVATSPTMTAIAPEAAKLSIPVLAYGKGAGESKKDSIFELFADQTYGDTALGVVAKSMVGISKDSIVGVYTNDETLVNFYNAFKQSLGLEFKDFVLDPSMIGDAAQIKAVAEKVAAENPKYIFMSNYANLGAGFVKEYLAIAKTKPTFIFDLTLNHVLPDYAKVLGDTKVLNGSVAVSTPPTDLVDFSSKFKQKYSTDAGELAPYGYDALAILMGTNDGTGNWIDRINRIQLKGVTGSISYDETGRRVPQISVTSITNGQIPESK